MNASPASPASTLAPCGCTSPTTGGEPFSERLSRELRTTPVVEWLHLALGAGALYLSWRIYKEIQK